MDDVQKMTGDDRSGQYFPAGIFLHQGFPHWALVLPGWKPAGHLAGIYQSFFTL